MSSAFDVPKAVDKRVSTMAVDDLAKRAHRALACKYYSLYDGCVYEDGFPFHAGDLPFLLLLAVLCG